jgi:hypothetical protein
MDTPDRVTISPYLDARPMSLYEACRKLRRDDEGRACATCPVLATCLTQRSSARYLGTLAESNSIQTAK